MNESETARGLKNLSLVVVALYWDQREWSRETEVVYAPIALYLACFVLREMTITSGVDRRARIPWV